MSDHQPETGTTDFNTTLDKAVADPQATEHAQELPGAVHQSALGGRSRLESLPLVGGVIGGISALVALVLLVRSRRKPPTPQERLAQSAQVLGTAAVGLGARAAKKTATVAEPLARDAASKAATSARKAAAVAAPTARDAAAVAASTAREAATLAAGTAQGTAEIAAGSARKVAEAAAGGAQGVVDGVEAVRSAWHKLVTRLIVVVFGGAGYVLGARAGRERYDQLAGVAQQAVGAVRR